MQRGCRGGLSRLGAQDRFTVRADLPGQSLYLSLPFYRLRGNAGRPVIKLHLVVTDTAVQGANR